MAHWKFWCNHVYFGPQTAKNVTSFDSSNGRPSRWALPRILVITILIVVVIIIIIIIIIIPLKKINRVCRDYMVRDCGFTCHTPYGTEKIMKHP